MWKQYIISVEIQNLIILIFPIIANKINNFIHFRQSNVAKILSINRPKFISTLILMDGSTLTNESMKYLINILILYIHDI